MGVDSPLTGFRSGCSNAVETFTATGGAEPMATIRDVARIAGVSLATASRALSGAGPVSPEAQERVRLAAQSLGYQVNKAARSLRTRRSDTLGLLIPDVRNPFFAELAYVIEQFAGRDGMAVITMSADEDPERQAEALHVLVRQQVDGLIVAPQGEQPVEPVVGGLPLVYVDRDVTGRSAPLVCSDNAAAAEMMIDHLVERGHRRIAMITGPQTTSTGRVRKDVALGRLAEHGCSPDPSWVQEGDFQLESGRRGVAAILAADRRPTAVFAGDNLMAVGALLELREQGLRAGRDIALACFDDAPWFTVLDPPLTVVAQDVAELGRCALDSLRDVIGGRGVPDVTTPVRLRVRESCRVPAAADVGVPSAIGGPRD